MERLTGTSKDKNQGGGKNDSAGKPYRSSQTRLFGIEQLADMIEDTGWFESDFQAAFKELADHKLVANLDDTTKRRKKNYVYLHADHNKMVS